MKNYYKTEFNTFLRRNTGRIYWDNEMQGQLLLSLVEPLETVEITVDD
jgi:hypothetical protein